MRHTETVRLTRTVKALCPHQAIDEYTPDAWHVILGHLNLADCMEAVAAVNGRQPFIAPADIIREIAAHRGRNHPHSQACRAGDCKLCLFGSGDGSWCMCVCHPRAVKALTGPNPPAVPLPKAPEPAALPAGPRRFDPKTLRIGRDIDS